MQDTCHYCKKDMAIGDLHENEVGHMICDDCSNERCMRCEHGLPEVKTRSGDYICVDCHSGDCDAAYEYIRDQEY